MFQTISAIPYIGDLSEAQILIFSIPTYREEYMYRVADHLTIENIKILLQNISAIPYIGGLAEAQILLLLKCIFYAYPINRPIQLLCFK